MNLKNLSGQEVVDAANMGKVAKSVAISELKSRIALCDDNIRVCKQLVANNGSAKAHAKASLTTNEAKRSALIPLVRSLE